jgi:hypothetical protein
VRKVVGAHKICDYSCSVNHLPRGINSRRDPIVEDGRESSVSMSGWRYHRGGSRHLGRIESCSRTALKATVRLSRLRSMQLQSTPMRLWLNSEDMENLGGVWGDAWQYGYSKGRESVRFPDAQLK